MLKYKALYSKMVDDLKDSGMWINWAENLKECDPEVAKYLVSCAEYRIEKTYPEAMMMFESLCKTDQDHKACYFTEMIGDHLAAWHKDLEHKITNFTFEKEEKTEY